MREREKERAATKKSYPSPPLYDLTEKSWHMPCTLSLRLHLLNGDAHTHTHAQLGDTLRRCGIVSACKMYKKGKQCACIHVCVWHVCVCAAAKLQNRWHC